jgi:uncharacterized membrane protein
VGAATAQNHPLVRAETGKAAVSRRDTPPEGEVAMTTEERGKRPASPTLAGPYGHPFHPILVTVPIGAWISSLVFDIGSHAADNGRPFAQGAMWLIAIGVIGALLAAAVGLMDLLTVPRGTLAFRTGLTHAGLNVLVLASYVINFFWRQSGYDTVNAVPVGQIVLSAITLAVLAVSGSLGGTLAYRYGVRVVDERTQTEGFARSS